MRAFLSELIADIRFAQANPELFLLVAVLVAAILGAACSALPDPSTGKRNACLPEAIMMVEALKDKDVQAKVLLLETPQFSHALATYLYPPGSNKLWGWDSTWKSLRLRAWTQDPESVAKAWLERTHPNLPLSKASFL